MNKSTRKLLKENNKREELLTKRNNEIFTDIVCYIRGANISEYNQEVVRADLIEMILDAQDRGDDIEDVFGGDNYKIICDNIIAELPEKTTREILMDRISLGIDIIAILVAILVINQTLIGDINRFSGNITITVGTLISWIIIAVVANYIVYYICKNPFKDKKSNKFLTSIVVGFIFALVMIPGFLFTNPILEIKASYAIVGVVAIEAIKKLLEYYVI